MGTLLQKANKTAASINDIKSAIISKGQSVGDSDKLSTWGNKIRNIVDLTTGTASATATAADIKSGKTAYVKGNKITGTLSTPTFGACTVTFVVNTYAYCYCLGLDPMRKTIKLDTASSQYRGELLGTKNIANYPGYFSLSTTNSNGAVMTNVSPGIFVLTTSSGSVPASVESDDGSYIDFRFNGAHIIVLKSGGSYTITVG